jgi:serine protease inhibitor
MSQRNAITAVVGVALWIVGLSGQASCAPPKPTEKRQPALKEQVAGVVEANNRFGFDLYQRLRSDQGNLFFSPASISMALAMIYAGAADKTELEMAKVLHFSMPKAQLNEGMRGLRISWNTKDAQQGFRLDVANRLWGQEGCHFLPEFLRVTRADYGAELEQLDFRSAVEQARRTINAWVENQTARKITSLIPSAAAIKDARLVLTNVVYFKGKWQKPFDKGRTQNQDFQLSVDHKIQAQTMITADYFRYTHVEGLQLLDLRYGDGNISMVVLLPEFGKLSQLEERLSPANLQAWTERLESQEVIVYLPKFKTTSKFHLSDTLRSMGMVSTFDLAAASFSGMTGDKGLCISAMIHEALIDVNEEFSEAIAATAGAAVGSPDEPKPPPVFRADHPFVFLIRDNRTGAILFLGRIVDPTS